MVNKSPQKAVIYCRTPSTMVSTPDAAIASQEARCLEYARRQGYQVVSTFLDAAPGTVAPRAGMDAMLDFLAEHQSEPFIVVVDSMSVLAHDVDAYVMIRTAIHERGATLKSPSLRLGANAENALIENLRVSFALFEGKPDHSVSASS